MWPLRFVSSQNSRKQQRAAVTLNLEALEDRWLPNGAIPQQIPQPPNFVQAAFALYTEGVVLGEGWVNQTFFGIDPINAYRIPPAELNADIAFNSPYVGPFAPLFVLTGQIVGAQVQYHVQIESFKTF